MSLCDVCARHRHACMQVMQHERLLGTAGASRSLDASGRLSVSHDELMHFLRSQDAVVSGAAGVVWCGVT